eukprot:1022957-Amphidinium_carterae.1
MIHQRQGLAGSLMSYSSYCLTHGEAASLGVTAVQVKGGISLTHLYEGLKEHKRHHSPGYETNAEDTSAYQF